MTLASTAADTAPNWPLLALIGAGFFFGFWWLCGKYGGGTRDRDRPGTDANLRQRLRAAHHDAIVEDERRRAREQLRDDQTP